MQNLRNLRARVLAPLAGTATLSVMAATLFLGAAQPAHADNRWQEAAGGAVAILPKPADALSIVGGSLSCAQQKWSFVFRTDAGSVPAGIKAAAKLIIGDNVFESEAQEAGGTLAVAATRQILQPLRTGSRLGVSVGDKGSVARAIFSLGGSRDVLDAIAPRCTPVDMAPYQPVTLSQAAPSVATASGLMKSEAKLFRAATGKQPVYATAMIELGGDRRLMFASLCGSTSYYGPSGCTLRGYAAQGADAEWREVYNTEGVQLFRDAADPQDGWPKLATLPVDGDAASHWAWSGDAYALTEAVGQVERTAEEGDSGE